MSELTLEHNRWADVLVVGGGTSGCVLAARLSEDPARTVTLVEEGPDDSAYDHTVTDPRHAVGVSRNRAFAEGLRLDVAGAVVPLARGRVLGGTSAVNYLATVRGHPADYDGWAARGLPGWSWDDVLPAFRRAENDLDLGGSALHGDAGPLTVRRWTERTWAPAHAAFADGLRAAGVPWTADLNDPTRLTGVGAFPAGVVPATGDRLTVSRAYLDPEVRRRPNLTVVTGGRVVGLTTAAGGPAGSRVTGVRTDTGLVLSAAEVVVAAGAVGSPALLMRSGIGPAGELRAAGIAPLVDLPGVGRHLQDHLGPAVVYRIRADGAGTGGPAQTVWAASSGDGRPDVHVFPVLLPGATGPADETTFALLVFSLRPEGRGAVRLRADAPLRRPLVDLPPPGARETAAVQGAFDVLAGWEHGAAARDRGVARVGEGDLDTPGAAVEAMRSGLASYAHLVGSCAMGPDTDLDAVVDADCRVRGVDGLRVVDASVMPTIPTGNTYLTCVMIAEQVAARMS